MGTTKIKICGLQTYGDVRVINEVMPDYIGFVFAKSSRRITEEAAYELKQKLAPGILSVGVFVNEEPDTIIRLCRKSIIDIIQLHGDEDNDYVNRLSERVPNPVIRAIRVRSTEEILRADTINCDYLLLDAYKEKEYGGSGVQFDWSLIPEMKKQFFLAGGINSSNVFDAIERFHPFCIDVSTGVETDGCKDLSKVKELMHIIRNTGRDE